MELIETSLILANCTQDSFLIIDELGRGTSTYDGSAIVYAVLKYLSTVKRCRMLFSTHYNFIITTFLYKLVDGVCPDSFGINVARLANIPEDVLTRAKEMADSFNIDLTMQTPLVRKFMYQQLLLRLQALPKNDLESAKHLLTLLLWSVCWESCSLYEVCSESCFVCQ